MYDSSVAMVYAFYYISLEPVAGLVAFTWLYNGSRLATAFISSNEDAVAIATGVHVLRLVLILVLHHSNSQLDRTVYWSRCV